MSIEDILQETQQAKGEQVSDFGWYHRNIPQPIRGVVSSFDPRTWGLMELTDLGGTISEAVDAPQGVTDFVRATNPINMIQNLVDHGQAAGSWLRGDGYNLLNETPRTQQLRDQGIEWYKDALQDHAVPAPITMGEDGLELDLENLGYQSTSMLTPMGWFGALGRGGGTAAKVAGATSRTGRTANAAASFLLPGTYGRYVTNAPIAATGAMGMPSAIVAATGGDINLTSNNGQTDVAALLKEVNGQGSTSNEILEEEISRAEFEDDSILGFGKTGDLIAGGGAVILGGAAARRAFKHVKNLPGEDAHTVATGLANPEGLQNTARPTVRTEAIGDMPKSATKAGEMAATNAVDANSVLRSYAKRAQGMTRQVQDFIYRMEQVARTGGAISTNSALQSGKLSNNVEIPSITVMRKAYNSLDARRRDIFDRYMIAADAWDQHKAAKAGGFGNKVFPSATGMFYDEFGHLNMAKIRQVQRAMKADPELQEFVNSYRKATHGTLDYLAEQGVITRKVADEWKKQWKHYMPNMPAEGKKTWTEMLHSTMTKTDQEAFDFMSGLMQRKTFEHGGGVQEFVNPMDALASYVQHAVHFSERNRLRRDFVDMMTMSSSNPELRNSIKKLKPNQAVPEHLEKHLVRVRRGYDGQKSNMIEERYLVGDPMVAKALEFQPYMATTVPMQGWNMMRKMAQWTTTGPGAPLFAVKSATWDALLGSAIRPDGRRLGFFGFRGDPTIMLQNMGSMSQDMAFKAIRAIDEDIKASLMSNSSLYGFMPTHVVDDATKAIRNSFMNSPRAVLEAYGGMAGHILDEASMANRIKHDSLLGSLKTKFEQSEVGHMAGGLYKFYKEALDSVHNGTRLSYFNQNVQVLKHAYAQKHGIKASDVTMDMLEQADVRRLVQETKELTGDFSKRGLFTNDYSMRKPSDVAEAHRQAAAAAVAGDTLPAHTHRFLAHAGPYYNVTVQAFNRLGKALAEDFGGTTIGIFNSAVIPVLAGATIAAHLGPEYSKYYWQEWPGWKRATTAYFPIPGLPPEQGIEVPIPPEMAFFASSMLNSFDAVTGISHRAIGVDDNTLGNEFFETIEAAGQLFNIMLPPAIPGALALTGHKMDGFQIRDIRTEYASGSDRRTPDSFFSANVEELLTSLWTTTAQTAIGATTAYQAADVTGAPHPITGLPTKYAIEKGAAVDAAMQHELQRRTGILSGLNNLAGVVANKATGNKTNKNDPGLLPIIGNRRPASGGNQVAHNFYKKRKVVDALQVIISNDLYGGLGQKGEPNPYAFNSTPQRMTPEFQQLLPTFMGYMQSNPYITHLISQRADIVRQQDSIRGWANTEETVRAKDALVEARTEVEHALLLEFNKLEGMLGVKLEDIPMD